ncbi:hypothetical protein Leryth_011051 [Lithospermum erythrorhizon]|uniref:Hydrolase n=1 Tax=Lithospermum erythrorhizon TaxID=34254 RepID=A0AAV3P3D4_LITER|nr:hypothetical protein Leryth_011051 [Lithospermum erythrorhizon]
MEEGQSSNEKRKVMVAISESEYSRHALEWALEYFHDMFVDAEVVIFNAQSTKDYSYVYAYAAGVTSPELLTTIREKQQNTSTALLEMAKNICEKYGVQASTACEVGDPKEVICEAVEKLKIQLLVVGSHGRGAVKRALLGSVSDYCINYAKCPVLVVKKKA